MTPVEQHLDAVSKLLTRYGLQPVVTGSGAVIPGSYWGESEAGLIGNRIYFRPDTPLHSVLHEACHFICMDDARRAQLERDADDARRWLLAHRIIDDSGRVTGTCRSR